MPHRDPTAAKEYQRQYQARNKDRISTQRKAYYEANKARLLAQQKVYGEKHKAEKNARSRAYYLKNKPALLAKAKDYAAITKARIKERQAGYRARNAFDRAIQIGRPKPDVCDACGGNEGGIVFDHCHERGHARGWLCWRCNIVLGHVGDNPEIIRKMIAYLQRTRKGSGRQGALPGI